MQRRRRWRRSPARGSSLPSPGRPRAARGRRRSTRRGRARSARACRPRPARDWRAGAPPSRSPNAPVAPSGTRYRVAADSYGLLTPPGYYWYVVELRLFAAALVAAGGLAGAADAATQTTAPAPTLTKGVVLVTTNLAYQNAGAAGTGIVLTKSGEIL